MTFHTEFERGDGLLSSRVILAAAVASAAIVAVIGVGLYLAAGVSLGWNQIPDGSLSHSMFFFFLFGWPIAICCTLAAAAMGTWLSKKHLLHALSLRSIMVVASVLGACATSVTWFLFWKSMDKMPQIGALGMLAGLIGGALFWAIWRLRLV